MITFPELIDFVIRLTVILSVGLAIAFVLRRASAAERHLVLLGVVVVSLLLPIGLLLVPRLSITVPVSGPPSVFQSAVVVLAGAPSNTANSVPATASSVQEPRHVPRPGWTEWLLLLAAAGALVQAARMVFGFRALVRIERQSAPFEVPAPAAFAARRIAGLGDLPPVRLSAAVSIPFLRGWRRPSLFLPADAKAWPEHKLVMVLAHEMAHIRRRDHRWQPVLLAFSLLYWWHPLARLVIAKTMQERERACDDIVLSGDVRASDYAELLVETAGAAPVPAIALAMASTSRITGRVRKILSNTQRRVPANRLILGLISTASLVLFLAVTVAGVRAEDKPQASASPEAASPQIEIECKVLQITEESYQQNREFFESAIDGFPSEAGEDFLKKLKDLKGLDMLSAPKITTQFGKKAKIDVIREFPFPDGFDKDGKPTAFKNRDVGVSFELEASENNGKILLNGSFFITETLGSGVEGRKSGAQTPTFQTREGRFLREQTDGMPSLVLIPGNFFAADPPSAIASEDNGTPSVGGTRLMLWTNVTVLGKEAPERKKGNDAALQNDLEPQTEPSVGLDVQ